MALAAKCSRTLPTYYKGEDGGAEDPAGPPGQRGACYDRGQNNGKELEACETKQRPRWHTGHVRFMGSKKSSAKLNSRRGRFRQRELAEAQVTDGEFSLGGVMLSHGIEDRRCHKNGCEANDKVDRRDGQDPAAFDSPLYLRH